MLIFSETLSKLFNISCLLSTSWGYRYIYLYPLIGILVTPNPREGILIAKFRAKLTQFPKRVLSQAEFLPLIAELRLEHAFPRSLSERSFLRRLIEDGILKEIPLLNGWALAYQRSFSIGTASGDNP
jgi:hypothetical protein